MYILSSRNSSPILHKTLLQQKTEYKRALEHVRDRSIANSVISNNYILRNRIHKYVKYSIII